MSSFMTISGPKIDLSDLKPIELIEASKAQEYIQGLENDLINLDGGPVYLVHDGSTYTSDEFVGDAWNYLQEHKTIKGTILFTLIQRLISNGNTFRIWYADNSPTAYLRAVDCSTLEEILKEAIDQGSKVREIEVRYSSKRSDT